MIDQFTRWDYYYSIVRSSGYLARSQKERAIKSLDVLRKSFGNDWLFWAVKNNHPIFWDLRGIEADGNLSNILTLGNAISRLKNVKGFVSLFWKLKKNKDFYSTFTELEVAFELRKKKASIVLEPQINGKKPDILCEYRGKQVLFEVKSLGQAKNTLKATITVSTLSSHRDIPIHPCGKVFKIMEGNELQDTKNEVSRVCNTSIKTNSPSECHIPGKVKFYFVPEGVKNRVEIYQKWCDKQDFFDGGSRGRKGGLLYPNDNVSQEKRVLTRLSRIKKEKQLPENKPGIVFFESHQFYFFIKENIEKMVGVLRNNGDKIRNIVAIVLESKVIGDEIREKKLVKEKNDHVLITSYPFGILQKDTLIIKNPFSNFEMDLDFITKLFY